MSDVWAAQLLDSLAAGLRECLIKQSITDKVNLQPFVEGILRSRIGRRVLAEHHIGLHDRKEVSRLQATLPHSWVPLSKGFIGCICTELDVHGAIEAAASEAQSVCKQIYGSCPDVTIEASRQVSMPYIPGHLDYMLFELFKNSMR